MFSISEWFADKIFGTKEEISEHFRKDSLEYLLKPAPLWIPEDTPQSRKSVDWMYNKFYGPKTEGDKGR